MNCIESATYIVKNKITGEIIDFEGFTRCDHPECISYLTEYNSKARGEIK